MRSSVSTSRMHVAHAQARFVHEFGQILGHALGERGDERAIACFRRFAAFVDAILHLVLDRRISTGGSIRPVGRITCSAKTPPVCSISQLPGVAET
jgi:hypothetical protein